MQYVLAIHQVTIVFVKVGLLEMGIVAQKQMNVNLTNVQVQESVFI